jgi:hypothetical protein
VGPSARLAALSAAVLLLAVGSSGCLTVYPAKALFSGPAPGSQGPPILVVAFEEEFRPPDTGIYSDSLTRTVFVPPGSEHVQIAVFAKLTSVPPEFEPIDTRHFDFTVSDGGGTAWVDVHLRNNSTLKDVIVDSPRPGGWTVTLNYQLQAIGVVGVPADQFDVQVVVAQPAS